MEYSAKQPAQTFTKEKLSISPVSPVVKTPSSNAGGVGSISGQGTNVPYTMGVAKNLKKEKKKLNEQVLVRTWRNLNPWALLVKM